GADWRVYVGPPGVVRCEPFLGFEPISEIVVREGEIVPWETRRAPWGVVRFRLSAESDLCRGSFQVEASGPDDPLHEFPMEVAPNGEAGGGAWPAGMWRFRFSRSAEEGASALVTVRPGTEPTNVEVRIRNRLTR